MKVVWVNRSFLDYRIPVYIELDALLNGNFAVIFSREHTLERVRHKMMSSLGPRAISLNGEKVLFQRNDSKGDFANMSTEICFQPGLLANIKKYKPDVLIGEGFFKWTTAALIYRLLHGTPLIISYERTQHTERHSQWYRTIYRKIVSRFVDAVCCNGSLSAEYVESLGVPNEKIITGTMAADSHFLKEQCERISVEARKTMKKKLQLSSPIFLYVGQLIERKGLIHLLKAWNGLYETNAGITASLLIVGDGPERGRLESFARDAGLDNVFFAGLIDYDEIAMYYAIADIFIMPTLEDNWSLAVPEAMACGLPILSSKYNGCWPELVREGVNGFIFDPLNLHEFTQYIKYLIEHPETYEKMGSESRKIEAEYSPRNAARRIFKACLVAKGD